jgi:hypothetical protein
MNLDLLLQLVSLAAIVLAGPLVVLLLFARQGAL